MGTSKKKAEISAPVKRSRGRPSTYNAKLHPRFVYSLALRGLTDEQMAEELGITTSTFYLWQNKHKEFSESIKEGKENPDAAVEGALFKKATGFTQKIKKPMVVSLGQGQGSEVEIVEYEHTHEPDTTAQIFYLKNRRPDRWRDQQHVDLTARDLTELTPEQYAEVRARFLESLGGKGSK